MKKAPFSSFLIYELIREENESLESIENSKTAKKKAHQSSAANSGATEPHPSSAVRRLLWLLAVLLLLAISARVGLIR